MNHDNTKNVKQAAKSNVIITAHDATRLPALVAANDLEEIQRIVLALNDEDQFPSWQTSNRDLSRAIIDSLILQNYEIFEFFICKANVSANLKVDLPTNTRLLVPLIYYAVRTGKLPFVELLVTHGAEIKPHNTYGHGDNTAIRTAVEEGHTHIVEYLLGKGAEANGVIGIDGNTRRRDTYIAYAAARNNRSMVDVFMNSGQIKELYISFALAEERYGEEINACEKRLYRDSSRDRLVAEIASASDSWKAYYEKELKKFDEDKQKVLERYQKITKEYKNIITILMDCAVGRELYDLTFLYQIDISEVNFIGVSLNGTPITQDMLKKAGAIGWERAMITLTDLYRCSDADRRKKIQEQVNNQINVKGSIIRDGIVDFISLWRAAERGDVEVLNARLAAGVDPNEEHSGKYYGGESFPAIVWAAKNNQETIINILWAHQKFDVKTVPTAIQAAKKAGHTQLMLKLLKMQDVNQFDAENNTLLHYAVKNGNVDEVVDLVANRHANVNLKGALGYPLHIAARGSYDHVYYGKASEEHIKIIEILLAYRADANVFCIYTDENALMKAAAAGSAKAVELLLPVTEKKSVTKRILVRFDDWKRIDVPWFLDAMFASYRSDEWGAILKLLKANGADLSLSNEHSDTLLHYALRYFPNVNPTIFDECNMVFCDAKKRSYREICDFMRHLQAIDFIIKNNVDVSVISKRNGNTAFHELLQENKLEHLVGGYARILDRFLSRPGFDINATNEAGQTLLDIAVYQKLVSTVDYLISRGAKSSKGDIPEKNQRKCDFNGPVMQSFIAQCKKEDVNNYVTDVISTEDQLLIDMYRDEVSQKIIQIPVLLNGRLYDLDTLLQLHQSGQQDPFAQMPFDLSDIEPVPTVARELEILIEHLKETYSPKKEKASILASVNGFFGTGSDSQLNTEDSTPNDYCNLQ